MGDSIEGLPRGLVEELGRLTAFPHDPDVRGLRADDGPVDAREVEHVQTHISHVFLTRRRVYKLRKAVDPGFLHFGTRAERDADCLREVRLNRRLAPDVYLGVAAIERGEGGLQVGPVRADLDPAGLEHCVVMRRLPAGRDLRSLLADGRIDASHLSRIAERVARFHAEVGLGVPVPFGPEEWRDRIWAPVEEACGTVCASEVARRSGEELRERARAVFESLGGAFEARRVEGRAVDGHGDLHLEHVWLESDDAAPLFVDCIEFSDDLRRIDAAADVAFLAMDLCYRGRQDLAFAFLSAYAELRDDYGLYTVVGFFMGYRAAVRAKVAALASADSAIAAPQRAAAHDSLERHVALALRLLDQPRRATLVVMMGGVGSGKTTVARHMAIAIGATHLRSDQLRKRIGFAESERYGTAARRQVYAGLLERAEPVLAAGRPALLDATFASREERGRAAELAEARGVPLVVVEVRCDKEVARGRLARRAEEGRDASEAGPELLDRSLRALEPVEPTEPCAHLVVDTSGDDWRRALDAALEKTPALAGHLKRAGEMP